MRASDILPFSESLKAVGRPITYYPNFAKAFSSTKCGVFVSNFLFWEGRQSDAEGWIYKTQDDILEETGLSRNEQETARKHLKELGVLQEKKQGIPPKLYYKFDWNAVDKVLSNYFSGAKNDKKQVEPSLIYEMKEAFDVKFLAETNGTEFEWSKDKSGGKHWKGLKMLKEYFTKRLKDKNKESQEEPSKNDVLTNWIMFLDMLPRFHVERNLTPMLLYANINEIVKDMLAEKNGNNKKKPIADTGSTATQYI